MVSVKVCPNYTGVTCVDGSCPMIENSDYSCDRCPYYSGCYDCAYCGKDGKCELEV